MVGAAAAAANDYSDDDDDDDVWCLVFEKGVGDDDGLSGESAIV